MCLTHVPLIHIDMDVLQLFVALHSSISFLGDVKKCMIFKLLVIPTINI